MNRRQTAKREAATKREAAFARWCAWRSRHDGPYDRWKREKEERIARAIRDRRSRLGLSIGAAARSIDIDRSTWMLLESRTRAAPELETQTRRNIEWILRWEPGSLNDIALGFEPRPLTEPDR